MTTNQQALTTAAAKIITVKDRRNIVLVVPTADCYVGPDDTVTAANGLLLKAGAGYYLAPGLPGVPGAGTGDLWGITATGTATATFAEMANQD